MASEAKTKQTSLDTLLPVPPASNKPAFVNSNLMNRLIAQVNRNTIALQPPRDVKEVALQEQGELWVEVARTTDTVTIEDPDEPANTVDVKRTVTSQMFTSDGRSVTLVFDNSLADE